MILAICFVGFAVGVVLVFVIKSRVVGRLCSFAFVSAKACLNFDVRSLVIEIVFDG